MYKDKYPNCEGFPVRTYSSYRESNSDVICKQMPDPDKLQQEYDEYCEARESYLSEFDW